MITVSTTNDVGLLNWMINHPDIAPHVRDDSSPTVIDVSPLATPQNYLLRVDMDKVPVGFAVMIHQGDGVFEQHSGMLAAYRGRDALYAGRAVLRWMQENTACSSVVTWAFSNARHVAMMIRAIGFQQVDRSPWPQTVRGVRVDRINYSISVSGFKGE